MAGETRRQRRDARRAQGAAKPAAEPAVETGGAAAATVTHPRRGGFIRESVGELRKTEWPTRPQVIQGTIVVLIACAIVGAYLWGIDQVLRPFVREILLGQ